MVMAFFHNEAFWSGVIVGYLFCYLLWQIDDHQKRKER